MRARAIVAKPPPHLTHLRPPPSSVWQETPFYVKQNAKANKNDNNPTSSTTILNSLLHSTTELNLAQRQQITVASGERQGES